jgi:uncharacterized protein (DUF427 family)
MSLTLGHGPLSAHPADANYHIQGPPHRIFVEDSPKRVRVEMAGHTVADTRRAKLLHETGLLPVYYFPRADVRFELLSPRERTTRCPYKGTAHYWDVVVAGKHAEHAVWAYPEPLPEMQLLADYAAFYLERMDAVYEEEDKLLGHPRDPYHRVDVRRSSRHVRVRIAGEVIADSARPRAVFETGLPTRWYVPREDVRMARLVPSDKRTTCPYKGVASYWSLRDGPANVAWSYEEPLPEGTGLPGHLCFAGEGVEMDLDAA